MMKMMMISLWALLLLGGWIQTNNMFFVTASSSLNSLDQQHQQKQQLRTPPLLHRRLGQERPVSTPSPTSMPTAMPVKEQKNDGPGQDDDDYDDDATEELSNTPSVSPSLAPSVLKNHFPSSTAPRTNTPSAAGTTTTTTTTSVSLLPFSMTVASTATSDYNSIEERDAANLLTLDTLLQDYFYQEFHQEYINTFGVELELSKEDALEEESLTMTALVKGDVLFVNVAPSETDVQALELKLLLQDTSAIQEYVSSRSSMRIVLITMEDEDLNNQDNNSSLSAAAVWGGSLAAGAILVVGVLLVFLRQRHGTNAMQIRKHSSKRAFQVQLNDDNFSGSALSIPSTLPNNSVPSYVVNNESQGAQLVIASTACSSEETSTSMKSSKQHRFQKQYQKYLFQFQTKNKPMDRQLSQSSVVNKNEYELDNESYHDDAYSLSSSYERETKKVASGSGKVPVIAGSASSRDDDNADKDEDPNKKHNKAWNSGPRSVAQFYAMSKQRRYELHSEESDNESLFTQQTPHPMDTQEESESNNGSRTTRNVTPLHIVLSPDTSESKMQQSDEDSDDFEPSTIAIRGLAASNLGSVMDETDTTVIADHASASAESHTVLHANTSAQIATCNKNVYDSDGELDELMGPMPDLSHLTREKINLRIQPTPISLHHTQASLPLALPKRSTDYDSCSQPSDEALEERERDLSGFIDELQVSNHSRGRALYR
jgi:hypothetical protein